MSVLHGANILITGGTGSFWQGLRAVRPRPVLNPTRLVIFSRDELKQYEVRQKFDDDSRLRWFIGDVRDERRLHRAMHNVDYVIHAAALKRVKPSAEYDPIAFVKTGTLLVRKMS